jgi:hypothetical protein
MIGAYRRKGYGVEFLTAWSGLIFVVAAILFVDDCDLLHMCVDPLMSDIEFLARKQRAMYFWAKLLMATGGMLRDTKCFWYFMSYKFVRGVPTLRRKRELPGLVMVIPQHNGADVPIELLDVTDARKTLGVYTCPLSIPPPKSAPEQRSKQLQYMVRRVRSGAIESQGANLVVAMYGLVSSLKQNPLFRMGLFQ